MECFVLLTPFAPESFACYKVSSTIVLWFFQCILAGQHFWLLRIISSMQLQLSILNYSFFCLCGQCFVEKKELFSYAATVFSELILHEYSVEGYLKTIHIDCTATWRQRHRCESTVTLAMTTKYRQCGPMNRRSDSFPLLMLSWVFDKERGRQNSYIPKNERSRKRPFDEELQAKLWWLSHHWMTYFAQSSSSSSFSQNWWQHEHKHQDSQWHGHHNTQWRDHQWRDHELQEHEGSEDVARSWKQSAQVPSEDQQDYHWEDREWWHSADFVFK